MIARQSATVKASGFSTNRCLPAAAHVSACSRCRNGGVQIHNYVKKPSPICAPGIRSGSPLPEKIGRKSE